MWRTAYALLLAVSMLLTAYGQYRMLPSNAAFEQALHDVSKCESDCGAELASVVAAVASLAVRRVHPF